MTIKHTHGANFGRRVADCPRCTELDNGAAPVTGWGSSQRESEDAFRKRLAAHDCTEYGCGPVCVAFDN